MRKWLSLPLSGGMPFASLSMHGEHSADVARDAAAERFATLVPPHAPALLRVAAALVGTADAEDAAQEAVTRAWLSWASLRDEQAVRPWLLSITVNVCRQWRRGGFGRRQRLTQPLTDDSAEQLATFADDPGASDHAAALDLRHALNHLNHDLRLVVVLRYYGGMDATETGSALGIPAATVRTRLRRALGILRTHLQHADEPMLTTSQEGDVHV